MLDPVMSDGSRSGVHWMRRKLPPTDVASARASMVLPVPGRSWSSTWPPATSPAAANRTTRSLPTMTRWTFSSMRPRSSAARRGCHSGDAALMPGILVAVAPSSRGLTRLALALADHPRDDLGEVGPALSERHRVHAVGEHHLGDRTDMRDLHLLDAVVGGLGLRGAGAHEVGTVAVHLQRDRDLGDQPQDLARQLHLWKGCDALGDVRFHVLLRLGVLLDELVRVVLPNGTLLDDRDPLVEVADAFHVDAEAEAVEQLWPQLALFWVHRADQDESRGVRHGDALALDRIHAHRRRVQQYVDDVVVEQVHLIDVEDVAVGLGEDARLKASRALLQRRFEVDRPTTRSSDALMGSSTTRMRRVVTGRSPDLDRSRQSEHQSSGSSGWHPK